jgi:hypothetical protein
MGIVGQILCVLFLDKVGRRIPLVGGNIVAGCMFIGATYIVRLSLYLIRSRADDPLGKVLQPRSEYWYSSPRYRIRRLYLHLQHCFLILYRSPDLGLVSSSTCDLVFPSCLMLTGQPGRDHEHRHPSQGNCLDFHVGMARQLHDRSGLAFRL